MKIATVQFSPALKDVDASVGRAIPLAEEAIDQGAELLILPELADTGYDLGSRGTALELGSSVDENPLIQALARTCAASDRHAVTGICERDGDRAYNSAVLIGPDGPMGRYRKIHLFMNEKDIFTPGDAPPMVLDAGPIRVGMLVCFDWMFPEVWRSLALDGADVVCHPSNLVLPYAQQAALVHALVNRYYVATANRIGAEGELAFTGGSQIAGPDGKPMTSSPAGEPHVASAEIRIRESRNKAITPRNDAIADRRPELYGKMVEAPVSRDRSTEGGPGGEDR